MRWHLAFPTHWNHYSLSMKTFKGKLNSCLEYSCLDSSCFSSWRKSNLYLSSTAVVTQSQAGEGGTLGFHPGTCSGSVLSHWPAPAMYTLHGISLDTTPTPQALSYSSEDFVSCLQFVLLISPTQPEFRSCPHREKLQLKISQIRRKLLLISLPSLLSHPALVPLPWG